ncbi:MAG: hypothetical protein ACO1NX_02370 [Chitinophagaceae bacterium]
MAKFYTLILLALLAGSGAAAQQQWLTGYLKDSVTHFPITAGTISNNTTGHKVYTNEKGLFRIAVVPNDLVYALAENYQYDTLRYAPLGTDTITIYLAPTGTYLPTVTVQARYTRYQMDSIKRKAEFEENTGTRLPTFTSAPSGAFGVGINLDRIFKKKDSEKKKYEKIYSNNERAAYIDYRFSAQLVAYYTGLKGEPLRQFMYQYTPTYEWLRQHPHDDQVLFYINDKLKEFKAGQKAAPKAF